ncbi:MAG: rRNA maturation RNase YbeY [Pseudomonadota bacterium]
MPARIDVDIVAEDARWEAHDLEDAIADAVRLGLTDRLEGADGSTALVTILLTDDVAQRALNAAHRGLDKSTDVLSFPAHPGAAEMAAQVGEPLPLGDISLAYETVARDAEGEGVAFRDHVLHLVVHGALHLTGETHDAAEDAGRMEALEADILARLGIADPYA